MDTAQAQPAETDDRNAQLANAANAFKTFDEPAPERDQQGRFAAEEPEQPEYDDGEPDEDNDFDGDEMEAADEDSEDFEAEAEEDSAQPLPPSWPEDMADSWRELPSDTQQFILQRDAEQTRALNGKFQEIANARKAAEAEARAEANAKRDELLRETERLQHAFQALAGAEPDPRAFGNNTQAYQQAYAEWQRNSQIVAQLEEQRTTQLSEKEQAEKADFEAWKQQVESEWAPKLLEVAPELKDPNRGATTLQEMVKYATSNGIPEETFSEVNQTAITSPELLMIWKAMQYDKARAGKVKAKPKPGPNVRPGVSSPRSASKNARKRANRKRLASEGSIEAGAAVWKDFM